MKFIIKQEILLENLYHTSRAISSKNLIPILKCIKFDLTEDGLYLSASDNDISIRCLIPTDKIEEVIEYGSIVIEGKYIVDIIKKLQNEIIIIEVMDAQIMKVSTKTENDDFKCTLNGINSNEFPNLDLEETSEPIILKANLFKKIIAQTFFATSKNEARPLLTGINFRIDNDLLEVIATDSYRLAKKNIKLDRVLDKSINIVIPGRNLLELDKIILEDKDNLELHVFDNKILFKYKNILFLSRLLIGTYPATSSIIPNEFNVLIECSCNGLFNMIDRASLLTLDRDKNTIKLELKDQEMIITSNTPEVGNVQQKMRVETNDEISISFSSKYMLDCIKSFETENIVLYMNDDNSPIIIKSNEDESLIQLVLPIRTW